MEKFIDYVGMRTLPASLTESEDVTTESYLRPDEREMLLARRRLIFSTKSFEAHWQAGTSDDWTGVLHKAAKSQCAAVFGATVPYQTSQVATSIACVQRCRRRKHSNPKR